MLFVEIFNIISDSDSPRPAQESSAGPADQLLDEPPGEGHHQACHAGRTHEQPGPRSHQTGFRLNRLLSFSANKLAGFFYKKTNVVINILHNLTLEPKTPIFLSKIFLKSQTPVPDS
jgi:hypothetical protein